MPSPKEQHSQVPQGKDRLQIALRRSPQSGAEGAMLTQISQAKGRRKLNFIVFRGILRVFGGTQCLIQSFHSLQRLIRLSTTLSGVGL